MAAVAGARSAEAGRATGPATTPPLIVLGVSRSGTTLLRAMLDAHPEIAIPSESYFIPQLWDRHGEHPETDEILADLSRLARVREWGVSEADIRARIAPGASFQEVIAAVYSAYAASQGATRFGDKTPLYMQHLELLDQVFPGARYVHIVRDGRDAAVSFRAMQRKPRFNLSRPRALLDFACAWRREVAAARALGTGAAAGRYLEIRYEDLVAQPEQYLRELCVFADLEWEPAMLEYHRREDYAGMPDHPRLAQPPTAQLRDWRRELSPRSAERFEAIAGELLSELGYERAFTRPSPRARLRARLERGLYTARLTLWGRVLPSVRRSALWRLRQRYIRSSSGTEGGAR